VGGAGPAGNDYVPYFLFFLLAGKPHCQTTLTHCTSASSHRGEDDRCSPLVDTPAIEPRRNARCSVPPCCRW
jgi:hypothetical protein